ncbi:MAG: hypothetical protein OMM_01780 [Candidatus Magnetoglobus multicellularis str. Araruama]|uniref:CHAT domain-containing protein n=1 Tax=Candidatus Magnetoglobus multicellularis str. Araruama TaxID=890399 RepID=A0A1V1PBX6_9BACT|nr:MAG: hypothetical protein OMM_01780 [Candidatus Magnetoglobus multicellularis str. Araruama]
MRMDSMKNNLLSLKASKFGNTLRIDLHTPDYNFFDDNKIINFTKIEEISRRLIDTINQAEKRSQGGNSLIKDLQSAGSILCDQLLTAELKDKLKSQRTIENLLLEIDDSLVYIPWELIYLGNDFLCLQFNTGRKVNVRNCGNIEHRKISHPLTMWLLGESQNDLDHVEKEINTIKQLVSAINMDQKRIELTVDSGPLSQLTTELIQERLRDYDFVHFSGHSEYCQDNPENSGWKLTEGYFTAQHVDDMTGSVPMPAFVFPNACQSARTQSWDLKDNNVFDLARAFKLAGVKHFLGTFWNIMDKSGSDFSIELYKNLFSGKTFGEAVRLARKKLIETGSDVTWASYVLYGDPDEKIIDIESNSDSFQIKPKKPDIDAFQNNGISKHSEPIAQKSKYRSTLSKVKESIRNASANMPFFLIGMIIFIVCLIPVSLKIMKYFETEQFIRIQAFESKQHIEKEGLVDQLFFELSEIIGESPFHQKCPMDENDDWSSKPLGIAIISHAQNNDKDRFIADDISSCLEKKIVDNTRLKVVCRINEEIIPVLKELIRANLPSAAPASQILPQLRFANLILYVSLNHMTSPSTIVMKLVDLKQMTYIQLFNEDFNEQEYLIHKNTAFSIQLIKFLQHHYPLQGFIVKKQPGIIELNIGEESGVSLNQTFKDLDNNYAITVSEITSCTSTVQILSQKTIESSLRVKCIHTN